MKSLISFGVYVVAFVGTTYAVDKGDWTNAVMLFMVYLHQLVLLITEAIEKKQSC